MFKFYNSYIILILLGVSCTSRLPETHEKLVEVIGKLNDDLSLNNFSTIVVLPVQGCSPCIERTINFIENNKMNTEVLFIVVAKNKREWGHLFSSELFKNSNFLIDDQLLFMDYDFVQLFPVYFSKKNGYFSEKVEINGSNVQDVFEKISTQN
ncbi:hypothetical protein GCM10011506_37930 [Marivirga lumbricoides]|uniref:Alkyl hydroperoxide reductase subunit C/ Thiol specific antioxidant domain-containing protein n=2 Tax=Marivirga lumbricoides TaxID=1046115 RepID=A0ABQ1N0N4_9BACT|nr:hypothetical protein GCM10011506_37930 [Marivirga lumbricoides]